MGAVSEDEIDEAAEAWQRAKEAENEAWRRYDRLATGRPVIKAAAEPPKAARAQAVKAPAEAPWSRAKIDAGLAYYADRPWNQPKGTTK